MDEVAVQAPQAAPGVTVKDRGTSGVTPQLGWPELLGQVSGVEVPVGGSVALPALRLRVHDGLPTISVTGMLSVPAPVAWIATLPV